MVQFYPILFTTKGTVKCYLWLHVQVKKKRHGKKRTVILVGILLLFPLFLLNAKCELKLPKKNYIEPRLVLKHVSYIPLRRPKRSSFLGARACARAMRRGARATCKGHEKKCKGLRIFQNFKSRLHL